MWRQYLVLSVGLAACGADRYRPQLVELEETLSSSAGVAIHRTAFTYEGDELASVVRTEDSNQIDAYYFYYTDGWLDTVEVENADAEFVSAYHFRYRDGRVSRLERRRAVFAMQPPGEERRVAQITYGQNGVTTIDFSQSSLQDPDTETVELWQERYRYDDLGRIERISNERPGAVSVHELSYDEETGLLSLYASRSGGATVNVQYDYEEDSRLKRVSVESEHYAFKYEDNRVQEIVYTSGDLTVTSRYTYGDGSTRGITPVPPIPHGELFDLEGVLAEELDFATFAALR